MQNTTVTWGVPHFLLTTQNKGWELKTHQVQHYILFVMDLKSFW